MKKVIFFLSLCIFSISAMAQKPYAVYDWTGKASIKEYKTTQWSPVKKNQAVSGLDSVSIDKNSTLRIIDTRSNLIYKSTKTGKMRILTIINDAKNQNSRTLSAVNQELLNGAKGSSGAPSMQVVGATTRGSDDEALIDSIASTFGWVAKNALNGNLVHNSSDLILKCSALPEGVYFEMQNNSDKGYYVNVLHLNKQTKAMNLCYIIEQSQEPDAPFIFLPQGESVKLNNLIFNQSQSDIFILVGTEDQYIPEQLQSTLQYLDVESAQPLYHRYRYFKL